MLAALQAAVVASLGGDVDAAARSLTRLEDDLSKAAFDRVKAGAELAAARRQLKDGWWVFTKHPQDQEDPPEFIEARGLNLQEFLMRNSAGELEAVEKLDPLPEMTPNIDFVLMTSWGEYYQLLDDTSNDSYSLIYHGKTKPTIMSGAGVHGDSHKNDEELIDQQNREAVKRWTFGSMPRGTGSIPWAKRR